MGFVLFRDMLYSVLLAARGGSKDTEGIPVWHARGANMRVVEDKRLDEGR